MSVIMRNWSDVVYRLIVALGLEPPLIRLCDLLARHIDRHPRLYSWTKRDHA